MILDRPPASEGVDLEKLEHQKVVVDFRLTEGIPDDTRHYVIQRDKSGSYEVLSTGLIEDDKVGAHQGNCKLMRARLQIICINDINVQMVIV